MTGGVAWTGGGASLIGIVGYSPVLDAYPLGPKLMAALEAAVAGQDVAIENMTWSPIHIVQRFQDEGAVRPRRLVLMGAASVVAEPGRVRAFRWTGGSLPAQRLQERVYEAVTGIVDIENTLAIGTHFGVWPDEVFTVEVELEADTFGRMVIAYSHGEMAAGLGFAPADVVAALAVRGLGAGIEVAPESADCLATVERSRAIASRFRLETGMPMEVPTSDQGARALERLQEREEILQICY